MAMKRLRQLPENLRGIVELQKSAADGKLAQAVRETEVFLAHQKNVPREIKAFLEALKADVDLFKMAPPDAFRLLEERDRKKFTLEIHHLTEHPPHNFMHIVELRKAIFEVLEHMLKKSKFFGHEISHKSH